jgi:RNA polymerase sigma-70 factor, ECF subfamily
VTIIPSIIVFFGLDKINLNIYISSGRDDGQNDNHADQNPADVDSAREENDILRVNRLAISSYSSRGAVTPMLDFDEQTALDGAQNLNSKSISAIYDKYFPDVYRYVRYRLNDQYIAEDITGDVFVRLLQALQNKRGPRSNLKAWLLATASHIVTDHIRRSYRRPTEVLPEDVIDPASLPGEEYDKQEQVRNFRQAFSRLTPDQQHVLSLRFGDGYSLEETASVMKKNVNAVKALQFRALATLQRNIGDVSYE